MIGSVDVMWYPILCGCPEGIVLAVGKVIRILSPGRTFRKDSIDATHSPNFHQCEGLVVEKCSTVSDLKSVLIFFFEELIGKGCEIRMRPSYFPFVSPGFEVDFRSKMLVSFLIVG